ncbi:MAG: hypothetical protein K8W52_28905 [Deltaproteobacteria bacterium]|nr:hypothetical protein [Deltaproteobacteria bacterium]
MSGAELAHALRAQAQALVVLAVDADAAAAARYERLAADARALATRLGVTAGAERRLVEAARLRVARTARIIAAGTRSLRLAVRAA